MIKLRQVLHQKKKEKRGHSNASIDFYHYSPKKRKTLIWKQGLLKGASLSSYVRARCYQRVRHFARQSSSASNPFSKSGTTVSTLESRHCVETVSLRPRDFPSTIPRVVQGTLIFINSPSRLHLSLVVDTLAKPSHFSLLLHFHRTARENPGF